MTLLEINTLTVGLSAIFFLIVTLLLVIVLLVAKHYLVPSGKVKIDINGKKDIEADSGSTLLNTLQSNGVFLSSACGGKGIIQIFDIFIFFKYIA